MMAERKVVGVGNKLMFDIETMGKHPMSCIASIGAVVFNTDDGIIDKFYTNVSVSDGKKLGLRVDQETMDWWKSQPKEVIESLMINPRPVKESIEKFFDFYSSWKCEEVWAWGTSFDAPIIVCSMVASGAKPEPWKYWEMKCARTLCSMFDLKPERVPGKHHNALDDSIAQAECLLRLFNELK